jgi:hypothetical protein
MPRQIILILCARCSSSVLQRFHIHGCNLGTIATALDTARPRAISRVMENLKLPQ